MKAHYWATVHYDAHDVLKWIQKSQSRCKTERGLYCATIPELLEMSSKDDGYVYERSKLEGQPEEWPGLNQGDAHVGTSYHYSMSHAQENTFEARARWMSFASRGEDIWKIGPEGPPEVVIQSSAAKGSTLGDASRGLTLVFLVLYLILLFSIESYVKRRIPIGPKRALLRVAFMVGGVVLLILAGFGIGSL